MKVCITIDVEHDCPPFLDTYRGIDEGLPRLVAMLAEEQVFATFFVTGNVARRNPSMIGELVAAGHEVGCHGNTHRRFDGMTIDEARKEIESATTTLRRHYPVISFRAPNLALPSRYLQLLNDYGYRLDSSQGKYKIDYWFASRVPAPIARVPASLTSSVLRLARVVRAPLLNWLAEPVVLFVHPWEFVDFRSTTLRWDCRFKTGDTALDCLRESIDLLRRRHATFVRMRDLLCDGQR
jgi:peptidoglycan/xylan/chitin deacetylase (PgdA/CDA1 family)